MFYELNVGFKRFENVCLYRKSVANFGLKNFLIYKYSLDWASFLACKILNFEYITRDLVFLNVCEQILTENHIARIKYMYFFMNLLLQAMFVVG